MPLLLSLNQKKSSEFLNLRDSVGVQKKKETACFLPDFPFILSVLIIPTSPNLVYFSLMTAHYSQA